MPVARFSVLASSTLVVAALAGGCSSPAETTGSGGHATTGSGTTGDGGATTGSAGTGGASACSQVATMLDVSKAPGAGAGYAKPALTAKCTATTFVVDGNGMPPYTFVQTTPNALKVQAGHWEIPLAPQAAATTTALPLLGIAGFAVNGLAFYGPNEADQPANQAFGDPIFNGLMDPCLGHTSPQEYHYHSFLEKCLISSGLVAKPWMNADPKVTDPSPIIGWALDGYPIYGSRECADAGCAKVVTMQSGYAKIGDPTTYAAKAYMWKDHAGDATYLDACNGHTGPKGDYHYHGTLGYPYILGCYHGTPMGVMMGGSGSSGSSGSSSGSGMGPKACTMASDCVGACPPGSVGCTCSATPMGKLCVPTCTTSADCPMGAMGALTCKQGICAP